uniref:Uncharacterized protein n=1 Tax=Anguilla anguilla TaxID=7936 RepID=A0A0E9UYL0_ANGAN
MNNILYKTKPNVMYNLIYKTDQPKPSEITCKTRCGQEGPYLFLAFIPTSGLYYLIKPNFFIWIF